MPHISLNNNLPGIRSLASYRPDTGKCLYELAQILLHGESPLSKAERELMAAYVSRLNQCEFCCNSHAAASRVHFGENAAIVDEILLNGYSDKLTNKVNSLLSIAKKVAINGREVKDSDIQTAKANGAVDRDIHDTVLIAAAFSMFNRYVDGLAALSPIDAEIYEDMGIRMASIGYIPPSPNL